MTSTATRIETQAPTRDELIAMLRIVANAVQMPHASSTDTGRPDFTTGEQDSCGYDLVRMRMVVIDHVRELLARECTR